MDCEAVKSKPSLWLNYVPYQVQCKSSILLKYQCCCFPYNLLFTLIEMYQQRLKDMSVYCLSFGHWFLNIPCLCIMAADILVCTRSSSPFCLYCSDVPAAEDMTFRYYSESDFCCLSAVFLVIPSSSDNGIVTAAIKSLNKDIFQDDSVECLIIQCCFVIVCARHTSEFFLSCTLARVKETYS